MGEFLLTYEREIYSLMFFASITGVALWEAIAPRRNAAALLRSRWRGNISLAILNFVFLSVVMPVATVGFAMVVEERGLGILQIVDAPSWLAAMVGVAGVDFGRYAHHYLAHRVPLLWRFHRIHHSDLDYDFTVGLRFHPVEAVYTILFTFGVIAILGPPAIVVLCLEVVVVASGTIVHGNVRTPRWVERYGRKVFVTPDMHRIHHSVRPREHNSNFAAVFSLWDRLLGTYTAESADPHETMEIGLPGLRDPVCLGLGWMLTAPLRRQGAVPPGARPSDTERLAEHS